MPAIHSQFAEGRKGSKPSSWTFPRLPIKTATRGPAPRPVDPQAEDIVDEALATFKANVFFRNFEIESEADVVLIYLTLYIQDCLQAISKAPNRNEAGKKLTALAIESFAIPGNGNFALGGLVTGPGNRNDEDALRQYITQLRQEVGIRLLDKAFPTPDGPASKWWMCFLKRKFMNKSL